MLEPLGETRYYIESELPERLLSTGVLYLTTRILPADRSGDPALTKRTQIATGAYTTIDDDFDVFFRHTSSPGNGTQPRHIVVHVRNDGTGPVELSPAQFMITDGSINVMGADVSTRVFEEDWDAPLGAVVLTPGAGDVDPGDYAAKDACMTGPAGGPMASGCDAFDTDADDNVDLSDFARFSALLARP